MKGKKTSLIWSSPIRRVGSNILPPIPNEVYLKIFDYIQPTENLKYKCILSDLALVCRFFCFTMLPRIYNKLEFVGSAHTDTDSSPNYAAFCRAVVKDEEPAHTLAKHVRECVFRNWMCSDHHLSWSYNAFLGLYCNSLKMMSKIETVEFHSTPISKTMLRAIRGLKHLRALSIKSCTFEKDVAQKDIEKLSSLRLVEFRLSSQLIEGIEPYEVRALIEAIDLSKMQIIETDTWDLVEKIADEGDPIPLLTLDFFHLGDWVVFQKMLEKTPTLMSLHFRCHRSSSFINYPDIGSSLIPTLRHLTCPPEFLSAFVPGRPITILKISTGPLIAVRDIHTEDIKLMKKSTVAMNELSIPATVYFTFSVWEHLPGLKKLELRYETQTFKPLLEDISLVLRTFADQSANQKPASSIREVTFSVSLAVFHLNFLNLPRQHEIISTVMARSFPKLEKVYISNCIEWSRSEDGVWGPSISISYSMFLAGKIKTGEFTYIDHDGCIQRLLDVVFGSQGQV